MRNDDLKKLWRSSTGPDHPPDLRDGMHQYKSEDNNPPRNTAPFAQRAFPPDAMATIFRPARSAMTSGKANTRRWKLRFEPRTAPFVEPLMGWTGGTDTLDPDRTAARSDNLQPCTRKLEWVTLEARATKQHAQKAARHPDQLSDFGAFE